MKRLIFTLLILTVLGVKSKAQEEPLMGEIQMFAGNFAPRNWAFCNGQLLAINQNQALFSLLGTTYGGNGINTFALPNLQGSMAIGAGNGPGLTPRMLGEKSGVESVTLSTSQMPIHWHGIQFPTFNYPCFDGAGTQDTPNENSANVANGYAPTANGSMLPIQNGIYIYPTGGSQPHNNMQPYVAVNYIICIYGVYPSRN